MSAKYHTWRLENIYDSIGAGMIGELIRKPGELGIEIMDKRSQVTCSGKQIGVQKQV